MFDIVIIGSGVVGASIAYELSKYKLNICVVEKENDVSLGASRANSGIIHGGYDCVENSLMAKLNVEGNILVHQICKDLDVPLKNIGSLVIGKNDEDKQVINDLYNRGINNNVKGIKIIDSKQLYQLEPNLNEGFTCALYCESASIISPWELCIAQIECAINNGCKLNLNYEVTDIVAHNNYYTVSNGENSIDTKMIINASGAGSIKIDELLDECDYQCKYVKGEYYLLDKNQSSIVNHVIFQTPNKNGKGILITPTVHNNLLVGPTATNTTSDDTTVSSDGLQVIAKQVNNIYKDINLRENIRNFAGVRVRSLKKDFIIKESTKNKNYFIVAGIASPGLSASVAIAKKVVELVSVNNQLQQKETFINTRKVIRFNELSENEKIDLINKDKNYGRIVCRCENISEGEIINALNGPISISSIDAIKRRCNTGMGRCQGGFCGVKVMEIIAKHQNIAIENITADKKGSYIISNVTKKGV